MDKVVQGVFDRRLEPFATVVGELCVEWTHLEGWITTLFLTVGGWDWEKSHAAVDMARLIDTRRQIEAIKVGAVSSALKEDLCESIIACVDYIHDHLRPARNRFVHDRWMPTEQENFALLFKNSPSIRKSVKGSGRAVVPGKLDLVHIQEVKNTIVGIIEEGSYIDSLISVLKSNPHDTRRAQLPEPPRRHLLPVHKEKQRQLARSTEKLPRPPKPSAASRRKAALNEKNVP